MKIYRAIAIAAALIASPASAADLYGRAPGPAYAAAPFNGYNWNGAYVGANLGYQWGKVTNWGNAAPSGVMGGGQVGYNWQSGPLVYGLETDIQFSSASGTLSAPCAAGLCGLALTANYSQEVSWFGTVRGRVGYASGGWLLYATGGYAYGQLKTDANASAAGASATFSATDFIDGWTAGAGIEVLLAPRWSLKGEYLYADLGRANHTFVFTGVPALNDSAHVTLNIVRAGVNFRF